MSNRKHPDWNITNWTGRLDSDWSKPPEHHRYRLKSISVTSGKWDVCTEPKDTKWQHPPRYNLFTLLPPDNRYRSICCFTSRLHSSFTPQTVKLLNPPPPLHFPKYMYQGSKDSNFISVLKNNIRFTSYLVMYTNVQDTAKTVLQ